MLTVARGLSRAGGLPDRLRKRVVGLLGPVI
jgi:hypothetical protein